MIDVSTTAPTDQTTAQAAHLSVLLGETIDALLADRVSGIYVDATFGRGICGVRVPVVCRAGADVDDSAVSAS